VGYVIIFHEEAIGPSEIRGEHDMARIKVIETGEFTEAVLFIGCTDIVTEMLDSEFESYVDHIGTYYVMSQSDADWWERWAETEAKILVARDNATDEQVAEDERLIDWYGYDLEMLQDEECKLFGIER
jgi:hypothetical protein